MTTEALREARNAWAHAQLALDTRLTTVLPAALALTEASGEELQKLLTDDVAHDISELYGQTVGLWAKYRELLRLTREG